MLIAPFHSEALEGELRDVGSSRLFFSLLIEGQIIQFVLNLARIKSSFYFNPTIRMDRKTYHLPFDSLAELELHLKGELIIN